MEIPLVLTGTTISSPRPKDAQELRKLMLRKQVTSKNLQQTPEETGQSKMPTPRKAKCKMAPRVHPSNSNTSDSESETSRVFTARTGVLPRIGSKTSLVQFSEEISTPRTSRKMVLEHKS